MDTLFPISSKTAITPRTSAMLTTMAEVGMSRTALLAMIEIITPLAADHRRFLLGPVVQHCSAWQDMTPSWLFDIIAAERLEIILDECARGEAGFEVGPAELAAVMFPATMDAPIHHEYARIYLWAAAHAAARWKRLPVADVWPQIGGKPVSDEEVKRPGGALHHEYRHLCADIRRRVVYAQAGRERDDHCTQRDTAAMPRSGPDIVQYSLFDEGL